MTDHREHPDQQRADRLAAFGDALVDGQAPPASDDIEAAMARAYRALGGRVESTQGMPDDIRHQIREELMTSTTATMNRSDRIPALPDRQAPAGLAMPSTRGWQAVTSFALILGVLASLVALAWQAGTGDGPGDPTPTAFAAQGLYDDDDPSTYPMMPEECVPNGEVDDEVDPADRSIDDWAAPEYAPAKAVPHETGLAIQETWMNFLRCENDAFDQQFPPGATPPVGSGTPIPPLERSPEMLTYFSDRLRYDHMYSSLSPEQQAELDEYRCLPRVDRIRETFPLPVNQPHDYAIWELLPADIIGDITEVFSPADVYLLPDGRYGAISGSVTTAALDDPNAVTRNDHLLFIAFVAEDGRYYIDEIFTVFAPDVDTAFPDGRNGTILMGCDES